MKTESMLKVASVTLSILGVGLSTATSILEEKKLDMKIAKEVSKQLGK